MKYRYPRLNAEMPSKEEVLKLTPNPATRELVERLGEERVETYLDRFEAQQPLCGFGLSGLCCQRCLWGPCRISPKAPRGTCGNDANLVIIGNLLRGMAAGCAAHGRHAQEVIETVIRAAEGRISFPILGEERVLDLARRFGLITAGPATSTPSASGPTTARPSTAGLSTAGKTVRGLAGELGRILLEDLSRVEDVPMRTLLAFAPPERVEVWSRLGILPRSAMYEVFEAMHVTTVGSCSDWEALARQDLRTALAYCYSTLFGSSLGAEMLFGIPEPREVELETGYGVLREDHVNILLHGHSPIMAEKVVEKAGLPEMQALAREAGARGIQLGGMCCTGNELLNRYGIPPVTSILGAEMALATGAVDALVVDMQCAIPGLRAVAECFGTALITTSDSNRFPGDTHLGWTAEDIDARALEVVKAAIEAYRRNDRRRAGGNSGRSRVRIPTGSRKAVAGWSVESIFRAFARGAADGRDGYGPQGSVTHRHLAGSGESTGRRSPPDDAAAVRAGRARLWQLIREGRIKGIVSIAGCNSPKVPFENSHVTIARQMVEWGALVLTTGCASYAILNAGLASREAAELNRGGLREVCREYGIPPVLAVGACTDNTRMVRLYAELAEEAGLPLPRMPFCHSGPEPGSEKNIGQGVHFLCHGITVHQGFPGGIPVPIPRPAEDARYLDDLTVEVTGVARFFAVEAMEVLGARVINEPYPKLAAKAIQMHLHRQRQGLSG